MAALLVFIVVPLFRLCQSVSKSASEKPNIIIFMADNLSFGDVNNKSQNTPNIDRLAEQGATFSRWYTQSSRISALASILTGLLPPRTGIIKSKFLPFKEIPSLASTGGLQSSEETLATVLKSKGYTTGFVGVWGLGVGRNGEYLPLRHGFDSFYGVPSAHREHCTGNSRTNSESYHTWRSLCSIFSPLLFICPIVGFVVWYNGHTLNMVTVLTVVVAFVFYSSILQDGIHCTMNFIRIRSCVLYKNNKIIEQPYIVENMTLRFTRSAVEFLEMASLSNKPFFLFVSFMGPKEPFFVSPLFSKSMQTLYHDALHETDWSIGRIVKTIKDNNKENSTLILVTSATGRHITKSCKDCVAQKDETPIVREKRQGSIWEQTICVPTVLNWKGRIKDRWLISTPVTVMDVMPSVLELVNVSSAAVHTDGKSLLPVLLNTSQESQHEYIFHYVEVTKPAAVTTGPYKLIYTDTKDDGTTEIFDPPLLFNVETDPEETSPLSNDEYSELLSNVSEALMRHMQTRKNKWHSQLDSRIIPFWFPCANLHCSQTNDETNNFSDLFDLDHDDT
ncbi:arylsulfatase L-like [Montipora foliosa]|uniref:arylsulfatase L-like n=1 Tax=Montipora foliosa TaxID=591990 RepID=UPI0035F14837